MWTLRLLLAQYGVHIDKISHELFGASFPQSAKQLGTTLGDRLMHLRHEADILKDIEKLY